jgi:hypothetical protein
VALALLLLAGMTIRKLTLRTETLLTLDAVVLERVRGGVGDIPNFGGVQTERCPPSQSGIATCVVWPKDSNGATTRL